MSSIDLRSDTVTRPTEAMLAAMMAAPTGDDVYGEDPTVNRLQDVLAERFGHEAGLFCPSGTMANQMAINVHTQPGDEVVCHRLSHIYNYEGGGIARNSGASVRLVHAPRGAMPAETIRSEVNPADSHFARTALVCVEDTVNKGGGAVQAQMDLEAGSAACRDLGLPFHLDGARAWNALRATGEDWTRYGRRFDSISLCLSKGLGTPVGSVLLGSRAFIEEAHRSRKVMGGGMRQVGILAAAARRWSSSRRSKWCSMACSPAAAKMPTWRMPPPITFLDRWASSMKARLPSRTDPTGVPSPFERHREMLSNRRP